MKKILVFIILSFSIFCKGILIDDLGVLTPKENSQISAYIDYLHLKTKMNIKIFIGTYDLALSIKENMTIKVYIDKKGCVIVHKSIGIFYDKKIILNPNDKNFYEKLNLFIGKINYFFL